LDKYTQKNSDFRKGKIDFMADRLITPNLKVVFEVDRLVWLFPVFRNLEIFLIPCIGFFCSMKFSCARIKFPSERKSGNHASQDRIKINESAEKCFSDTPVVSFLMVDRL